MFGQVLRTFKYADMAKESFQIQVDIEERKEINLHIAELLQLESELGLMDEEEFWALVRLP
jgi:hypothetical protein